MSSDTPQKYTDKDLSLVYYYSPHITSATSAIVSHFGGDANLLAMAVAASIVEEYHDRFETPTDTLLNGLADLRATTALAWELNDSIADVDQDPTLKDLRGFDKLFEVSVLDVGPGNIQIHTAAVGWVERERNPTLRSRANKCWVTAARAAQPNLRSFNPIRYSRPTLSGSFGMTSAPQSSS